MSIEIYKSETINVTMATNRKREQDKKKQYSKHNIENQIWAKLNSTKIGASHVAPVVLLLYQYAVKSSSIDHFRGERDGFSLGLLPSM